MENKEITFEEALSQLEQIVNSLENGSAPLDKSLDLFENGVRLVKICNNKLDEAEHKVKILTNTENGLIEKDFTNKDVY